MALTHTDDWNDYLSISGLVQKSGISVQDFIRLAVKEIVDNACDASERCEMGIIGDHAFWVQDHGVGIGLPDEEIAYLFSVSRKTYTTKGIRSPLRGAFGRGLRFVAGVVFCYDANLYVSTRGRKLLLKVEGEKTRAERIADYNSEGTRIEIVFTGHTLEEKDLSWGRLAIKLAKGSNYNSWSSPWWYDSSSFFILLKGLVYEGKEIRQVLRKDVFGKFNAAKFSEKNRILLRQKTAESITKDDAAGILVELKKAIPKKISPRKLGCVGEITGFDYYQIEYGSYSDDVTDSENIEIPFVLELWANPTNKENEFNLGKVIVFINKSPLATDAETIHEYKSSNKDIFYLYKIDENMFTVNALKQNTTFYLNVMTPYLPRATDAKIPLIPSELHEHIENIFNKVIKKINKNYKLHEDSGGKKRIPSGDRYKLINNIIKKNRESIDNLFSKENMEVNGNKYLKLMNQDPFMTGLSYTSIDKGLWFRDIWDKFNPTGTVIHLRRLHYRLVSQTKETKKHTGEIYENNPVCWKYILEASKFARELEMVNPSQIIDLRNPKPYGIFDPNFHLLRKMVFPPWNIPEIDPTSFQIGKFEMPELEIDESVANIYASSLQPVHLEIWTEKATMNDILENVCSMYGIVLVQNIGYASVTGIENYLRERALIQKRPSIIFYISDFDEAGENMPVSVSRTLQHRIFKMREKGLFPEDKEIIVEPIILKKEQMDSKEFPDLPKSPAKRGKGKVTELDALEAVVPGKFREIVEENIQKVLDVDVIKNMPSYFENAKHRYKSLLHSKTSELDGEIEKLCNDLREVTEKHKSKLQKISEELRSEYAPYQEKLVKIKEKVSKYADEALQNISINVSVSKHHDLNDPLFNSLGPFKEQTERMDKYRSFKKRKKPS